MEHPVVNALKQQCAVLEFTYNIPLSKPKAVLTAALASQFLDLLFPAFSLSGRGERRPLRGPRHPQPNRGAWPPSRRSTDSTCMRRTVGGGVANGLLASSTAMVQAYSAAHRRKHGQSFIDIVDSTDIEARQPLSIGCLWGFVKRTCSIVVGVCAR